MDDNPPKETEGREDYYEAAFVCIVLICETCGATLDADTDLGPAISFKSEGYYILLGDEAYRRGWLIDMTGDITAICPACAKKQS